MLKKKYAVDAREGECRPKKKTKNTALPMFFLFKSPTSIVVALIFLIIHIAFHFFRWFLGLLILSELNGIIDMGQDSSD